MVAIGEVAQRVGQLAAFDAELPGLGAGGDQQLVVRYGAAIGEHHGTRLAVDPDGARAAHQDRTERRDHALVEQPGGVAVPAPP